MVLLWFYCDLLALPNKSQGPSELFCPKVFFCFIDFFFKS